MKPDTQTNGNPAEAPITMSRAFDDLLNDESLRKKETFALVQVRIEKPQLAWLDARAKKANVNRSKYLRFLLDRLVTLDAEDARSHV